MIDYTSWANHYPNPIKIQLNPTKNQHIKMKAVLVALDLRFIGVEPLDTIKGQ